MFAAVTRHLQHHRLLYVPAVAGHGDDFGRGERSDDAAFEWWSMRRRAVVVSAFNRAILLPNTYPRDDVGQIFRGAIATAKPMGTVSTGGTEVSELDRLDGTARTADTVACGSVSYCLCTERKPGTMAPIFIGGDSIRENENTVLFQ